MTSLFYGGGTTVLEAQAIGSITITLATSGFPRGDVRCQCDRLLLVSEEGEMAGLELREHGISVYPEYVITATPRPAAMVAGEGVRVSAAARTSELGTEPVH